MTHLLGRVCLWHERPTAVDGLFRISGLCLIVAGDTRPSRRERAEGISATPVCPVVWNGTRCFLGWDRVGRISFFRRFSSQHDRRHGHRRDRSSVFHHSCSKLGARVANNAVSVCAAARNGARLLRHLSPNTHSHAILPVGFPLGDSCLDSLSLLPTQGFRRKC